MSNRQDDALPGFIRRDVERAIEAALHPKGMSVHDGKARIGADRLQYMLSAIASLQARLDAAEADAARYRWLRDSPEDAPGLREADTIYMQHRHGVELDAAIDKRRGAV